MKTVIVKFTDGKILNISGEIKTIRINPITNCLVVRWLDGGKNIFPLENVQQIGTE